MYVPSQVTANIRTDLADLSYAHCAKCGRIYNLNARLDLLRNPKCDKCNGPLVAAPTWVITDRDVLPPNRRITTAQGVKLALSIEEYTQTRMNVKGFRAPTHIHISDRSRPIATLEFIYGSQIRNPQISHKKRAFRYWLSLMPSEAITKPVR